MPPVEGAGHVSAGDATLTFTRVHVYILRIGRRVNAADRPCRSQPQASEERCQARTTSRTDDTRNQPAMRQSRTSPNSYSNQLTRSQMLSVTKWRASSVP